MTTRRTIVRRVVSTAVAVLTIGAAYGVGHAQGAASVWQYIGPAGWACDASTAEAECWQVPDHG